MVNAAIKLKDICSFEEKLWQTRQHTEKQRHHFANKGLYSQSYSLSSSHLWMWELEHREDIAAKNWCFPSMVLEKTLSVSWTVRRSNQSILKEFNPEYSLEGLMLKLNTWPPVEKEDSLEKTLMLGNIEGKKEKEAAKDEVVGWHHWLKVHEFEQTLRDSEGQGSLACCIYGVTKNWT